MKGIKWDDLPATVKTLSIKAAVAKAARQPPPVPLHVSGPAPNVEPSPGHASLATKETPRPDRPVDIRIVEYRKRLTDFDGGCSKYLLDALVEAGVLADDSLAYVQSVSRRQVKVDSEEQEKTEVTLWPVS